MSQAVEFPDDSSGQRALIQIDLWQPALTPGYGKDSNKVNIQVPSTLQVKILGTWGLMYAERNFNFILPGQTY